MLEIKEINKKESHLIFSGDCKIYEIEGTTNKIRKAVKNKSKIKISISKDTDLDTSYLQLISSLKNSQLELEFLDNSQIYKELIELYCNKL